MRSCDYSWLIGKTFSVSGTFSYPGGANHEQDSYLVVNDLTSMVVTMSSDSMYTTLKITCYDSSGTQLCQYSRESQGSEDKTINLSGVSGINIHISQGVGNESQQGYHIASIKIKSIS